MKKIMQIVEKVALWLGLGIVTLIVVNSLENGFLFPIAFVGIVLGSLLGTALAITALHILEYGIKDGFRFAKKRIICTAKVFFMGVFRGLGRDAKKDVMPILIANQELAKSKPDPQTAEYNYCREIIHSPYSVSAWSGLAEMNRRSNNLDSALGAADIALLVGQNDKTYNGQGQLWVMKARILQEDHRIKEAQEILIENQVEQLNPFSPFVKSVLQKSA